MTPYREASDALGPVLHVHRDRGSAFVLLWAGGLVVVLGAWLLYWGVVFQGIAYLATAVVGVFLGRRWLGRHGPSLIELHELGILQRTQGKTVALRFDDVRSIRSARVRHVRSGAVTERHTVEGVDGSTIVFSLTFDLARDLLAAIEARTLPRLRTEALRAFDDGKAVHFGPFVLSEEGLCGDGGVTLPWERVLAVTVVDGILHVTATDRSTYARESLARVPNAAILVEMMELAVEQARRS